MREGLVVESSLGCTATLQVIFCHPLCNTSTIGNNNNNIVVVKVMHVAQI